MWVIFLKVFQKINFKFYVRIFPQFINVKFYLKTNTYLRLLYKTKVGKSEK